MQQPSRPDRSSNLGTRSGTLSPSASPSEEQPPRTQSSLSTGSRKSVLQQRWLSYLSPPWSARCGVYGAPGSGKTTLAEEITKLARMRTVWIDPDPAPPGTQAGTRVGRLCRDQYEVRQVLAERYGQARIEDMRLADYAMSLCWHLSSPMRSGGGEYPASVLIVVDEAHNVFLHDSCPSGRVRLVLEGRRRGIALLTITQRPTLLLPTLQNCISVVAVGCLLGADQDWVRSRYGIKKPMKPREFALINTNHEPPVINIHTEVH